MADLLKEYKPSRLQNLTQANPRGGPQPKGARRTNGKREKVPLCVKPCRGRVFRQWEYRKFLGKTRKELRDKSRLLAMTWWRESMREGYRTGFRPNRAQSQRVQSNSVTSLRAESSLKGMGVRRLNLIVNTASRYEINDLKDRCRPRERDWYITLRREIEDADFLTQCGHWMEKTEKRTTHRKGIPQEHPRQTSRCTKPTYISKEKCRKGKWKMKAKIRGVWDTRTGSSRTQGLPAVIAAPTRWAAQTLELTFQSEIHVGSRRDAKGRLKLRITKCKTTRGKQTKRLRERRSESNGDMEKKREIFEPASCKQQRWKSRCALACSLGVS